MHQPTQRGNLDVLASLLGGSLEAPLRSVVTI